MGGEVEVSGGIDVDGGGKKDGGVETKRVRQKIGPAKNHIRPQD